MRNHIGGATRVIMVGGWENLGHRLFLRPDSGLSKPPTGNILTLKYMLQCNKGRAMIRYGVVMTDASPNQTLLNP
jgi:hypothetical protein